MIGALSLILPHPSEYNETALWSNVGIAFAAGFLLLLIRNRIPVWAVQLAVLGGTVVITRAVYFSSAPSRSVAGRRPRRRDATRSYPLIRKRVAPAVALAASRG
jgi:hypothetical protein